MRKGRGLDESDPCMTHMKTSDRDVTQKYTLCVQASQIRMETG